MIVIEHNLEVVKTPTGSSTWGRKAAMAAARWSRRISGANRAQCESYTGQYSSRCLA